MTELEKTQALIWYAVEGYDLATIAQHFGITKEQLAPELRRM